MGPKVTVSVGSSRPGGIDILLAGLTAQTFQDFEVVFTDGRYHKRHAQVLDAVKASGLKQPFFHVPNQRNSPDWVSSCAGVNTGFMLAAGEIVIMLLDYAYCPAGWIDAHLQHHADRRRAVMGPHIYYDLPEVVTKDGRRAITFSAHQWNATAQRITDQHDNFDEVSIFRRPFVLSDLNLLSQAQPPDQDPKLLQPEGPSVHDYMHTKNESFRREDILRIGGIDENYDRGGGPGDLLFGWQLEALGCELYICHDARVLVPNPRAILPSIRMTGYTKERIMGPGKWSYEQGEKYFRERMASGNPASKNPYNMREKSAEIWHWRELSQDREAVLPYIVKTDEEYFRGKR